MRKKIISTLIATVMLSSTVLAEDIKLEFDIGADTARLNDAVIEAPSYLSELENTMVGLRAVAETIGVTVEWNEETRTVTLSDEGLDMKVAIDSDTAIVNGVQVKMTEPAVIYKDRTMVPIRFVSEGFGARVEYIEETHSVIVSANSYDERCRLILTGASELKDQYPDALRGWLAVTDESVSAADFVSVWDSLVNTKIMELLPGRALTNEMCDNYRIQAKVTFNDMFAFNGVKAMDADITEKIAVTVKEGYAQYSEFTYTPSAKTISEKKVASSVGTVAGGVGGFWENSSSGSSGSGGGSVSKPTIEPTQTPEASSTATPSPTAEATIAPTASPTITPTPELTAEPTMAPAEETATPKPTRKPSSGGSGGGGWDDDYETATPEPTEIPQPTLIPATPSPTAMPPATLMPEATEVPEPTEDPDSAMPPEGMEPPTEAPQATDEPEVGAPPPEESEPTPEPTPQITDGPEGDDNHFDDVINGGSKSESASLHDSVQSLYMPWRRGFKSVLEHKNVYFRLLR